jgi:hypothetical protein
MASMLDQVPIELLDARRKTEMIAWIRDTHLPSRFKRRMLQEWAEAVSEKMSGADYDAVTER